MASSTGKAPMFFIDNILSKGGENPKECSKRYASPGSFLPAGSLMDVQFFGMSHQSRSGDSAGTGAGGGHHHHHHPHDGQRLLSTAFPQNPLFAGGCIPFPLFNPAVMHPQDVRNFLQGAPNFYGQYGFKPSSHMGINGLHPYFQAAGPTSRSMHKRKGGQVRFSNDQTLDLEQKFRKQKYLNPAERKKLAKTLTLSERQIKTWFQNRRAKWRRSKDGGEQTDSAAMEYDQHSNSATAPAASEKPASSASSSVSTKVEGRKGTQKHDHVNDSDTGRSTGSSPASFSGSVSRQEMCNSDSESVCSDDQDVVDA